MVWFENLQPASYRGVQFETKPITYTGGKKGKPNDRPYRDGGSHQDLGSKMRTWQVQAYFSSLEYDESRDSLIEALELKGAGEFVHPTMGVINALPTAWSFTEDVDSDGGFVRFNITFMEVKIASEPQVVESDTIGALDAIDLSIETNSVAFADDTILETQAELIEETKNVQKTITDVNDSFIETIDIELSADFKALQRVLSITTPSLLLKDLQTVMTGIQKLINLPGNIKNQFENLKDSFVRMIDQALSFPNNTTKNVQRNQCVLAQTTAAGCISGLAKAALTTDFDNRDNIVSAIDEIQTNYDTLLDRFAEYEDLFTGDLQQDSFQTNNALLENLQSIVTLSIASLNQKSFELSTERTITLSRDRTLLDLCFELYGNTDKLDELIKTNAINVPLLLRAGSVIIYYA